MTQGIVELLAGCLGFVLAVFGGLYCLRTIQEGVREVLVAPAEWSAVKTRQERSQRTKLIAIGMEVLFSASFVVAAIWFAIDALKLHEAIPMTRAAVTTRKDATRVWRAPSGVQGGLYADKTASGDCGTGVDFAGQPLTDSDLARFVAEYPRVTSMLLGDTALTASGISQLEVCENLQCLSLAGLPVADATLLRLAQLDRLVTLDLARAAISEQALECLRGMEQLQRLRLCGTQINDRTLQLLRAMHGLVLLDLRRTQVSQRGVEELQKALPRCAIVFAD